MLPLINSSKEFIIGERPDFDFVNYIVCTDTTFPAISDLDSKIRRECRGLIFDKQGDLISRPYHKFFNVNESEEMQSQRIMLDEHCLIEKLDGSMVRPVFYKEFNDFRWATKMGLSDVALQAEIFAAANPDYKKFAFYMWENGLSPVFEWVSPKNRIVVEYEKDNLILTAIRGLHSGQYINYNDMVTVSSKFNIPCVGIFDDVDDIEKFIEQNKDKEGIEGHVLRFHDGHMVKFKNEWYLSVHRTIDIMRSGRHLVNLILNDYIDDIKGILKPDDLKKVNDFERNFWQIINEEANIAEILFSEWYATSNGDRKVFASNYAKIMSVYDRYMIFKLWDKKDPKLTILEFIERNSQSEKNYDVVKNQFKFKLNA